VLTVLDRQLLQVLAAVGREASFVSSWAAKQQEIQASLARMEAQGLIKRREDVAGYRITDHGREQLAK
jgi:DNA-binding PadR family transcriptional regulator